MYKVRFKSKCIVISFIFILAIVVTHSNAEGKFLYGSIESSNDHPVSFAKVMVISCGDTLSQLTNEWGMYNFDITGFPVISQVDTQNNAVPQLFTLFQNYPNPFNPSTVIEYELSAAAHINLLIYNILGQKIRHLERAIKLPGRYRIIWDGRDNKGDFAGAGVYLYRLEIGGNAQTKKMLLLDSGELQSGLWKNISTGNDPVFKTTAEDDVEYELVVEKDGYESYHEIVTLPADAYEMKKDIVITCIIQPEDYFPLAVGNTWAFLDVNDDRYLNPDKFLSEWNITVIGSKEIDGKTYHILDRWSRFLPTIFHDDTIEPLVRFNQEGDFILRYRDVDIILYMFSEPEDFYVGYDLYEYFSDNSLYFQEHPELYERFIDMSIYCDSFGSRHPLYGISGLYNECRKVEITIFNGKKDINESEIYFAPDIGPIFYECIFQNPEYGFQEPYAYLKSALTGNIHYGVPPDIATSDTLTNADISEILGLSLESCFDKIYRIFLPSKCNIVMSTDNIPDISLIPPIQNITFILWIKKQYWKKQGLKVSLCIYVFQSSLFMMIKFLPRSIGI